MRVAGWERADAIGPVDGWEDGWMGGWEDGCMGAWRIADGWMGGWWVAGLLAPPAPHPPSPPPPTHPPTGLPMMHRAAGGGCAIRGDRPAGPRRPSSHHARRWGRTSGWVSGRRRKAGGRRACCAGAERARSQASTHPPTAADFARSGAAATVIGLLADVNLFWEYENREALLQQQQAAAGGGASGGSGEGVAG